VVLSLAAKAKALGVWLTGMPKVVQKPWFVFNAVGVQDDRRLVADSGVEIRHGLMG